MDERLDVSIPTNRFVVTELEDLRHCPKILRVCATDCLRKIVDSFPVFDSAAEMIAGLKNLSRTFSVLDLCSGSGGPWTAIVEKLESKGLQPQITLSDLFVPHPDTVSLPRGFKYRSTPTDAATFPTTNVDIVTMFNSFHHLSTCDAEAFLSRTAKERIPIAIFEITERTAGSLLMVLMTPALVLLTGFSIRPFRWERLVLTYIVPIIPLFVLIDGILSVARSYTVDELRKCAERLNHSNHQWRVGHCRTKWYLPSVLYMVGEPLNES